MHVSCQLIIVAIIYSYYNILAIESNTCDCDVLQVNDSSGVISYQNFTKQSGTLDNKPFYFSLKKGVIYSKDEQWSYAIYDDSKGFVELKTYPKTFFSLESICNNETWTLGWPNKVHTRCLKDNSKNTCSAIREFTVNVNIGDQKQINVQARDPCKFPFVYENVKYKSCTRKGHKFWCATSVNSTQLSTNHYPESWGYCNDFYPKEERSDEVAVKSLHSGLVVGILVSVLLILAFIIGYICIKKRKNITPESGK